VLNQILWFAEKVMPVVVFLCGLYYNSNKITAIIFILEFGTDSCPQIQKILVSAA